MSNTLKFGNGEWYGKEGTILAYNDLNSNYKPLPFEFERPGNATRVNKEGLIEVVGNNEPRIDYKDNNEGALLLEPTRTNVIINSENLNGAGWNVYGASGGNVTRTSNYGISPDGSQNSTRVVFSDGNTALYTSASGITGNASTTIYVKGRAGEIIGFGFGTSVAGGNDFTFNGNWQRLEFNGTSANSNLTINTWSASRNARDFEVYGVQMEAGSYATSYIPTSGSIGTRVADSTSQTVPDGVIGQTEGTLYAQLGNIPSQAIDDVFVELSDGTSNNRILFYADSNGYIRNQIKASGSISSLINTNVTVSSNMKIAITYKSNEAKVFINGVQYGGTDTSVVVPSVNKMNLENYTGTRSETSTLKDVKLYNTALTNQELIALTS